MVTFPDAGTAQRATAAAARAIAIGCLFGNPSALAAALGALPGSSSADWKVIDAELFSVERQLDLVVCAAASAEDAIRRWPAAIVIAIAPPVDGDSAVIAALEVGAACIRAADVGLVAAFTQAVARRHGLMNALTATS